MRKAGRGRGRCRSWPSSCREAGSSGSCGCSSRCSGRSPGGPMPPGRPRPSGGGVLPSISPPRRDHGGAPRRSPRPISKAGGNAATARFRTFGGILRGNCAARSGTKIPASTFRPAAMVAMAGSHPSGGSSWISSSTSSPKSRNRSPAEPLISESRPNPNCQRTNPENTSASTTRWSTSQASALSRSDERKRLFMTRGGARGRLPEACNRARAPCG